MSFVARNIVLDVRPFGKSGPFRQRVCDGCCLTRSDERGVQANGDHGDAGKRSDHLTMTHTESVDAGPDQGEDRDRSEPEGHHHGSAHHGRSRARSDDRESPQPTAGKERSGQAKNSSPCDRMKQHGGPHDVRRG